MNLTHHIRPAVATAPSAARAAPIGPGLAALRVLLAAALLIAATCTGAAAAESHLLRAMLYRGASDVKALVDTGADVNERTPDGRTLLMVAAGEDKETAFLLTVLLTAGADVNAKAPNGFTALMAAAYNWKKKSVQVLLDFGAAVDGKDVAGLTPLMHACRRPPPSEGASPDAVLELLLLEGADANAKDRAGRTALMHAMVAGQPAETMVLLRKAMQRRR